MKPQYLIAAALFLLKAGDSVGADFFAPPFQTLELKPSQMDFGGVGLMQMPTGRMADEGEFSFGFSRNHDYDFYSLSLQLTPWLESTIRYTQIPSVLYSTDASFSGDTEYADKGIDAKLRLWQEDRWLPELSLGIRDIGGTGLFDGEFIAATKRVSWLDRGQFDFTLGLGWGYLGQRGNVPNPFCKIKAGFCERSDAFTGAGGAIDYQRWFHGSSSLFAGVEYQTPYAPLAFKLEYDGNDYSHDFAVTQGNADLTPKTPWNIGAVYSYSDHAKLRLSYERGDTLTFGFYLNTNLDSLKPNWLSDEPAPKLNASSPSNLADVDWQALGSDLSSVAGYREAKIYPPDGKLITLKASQAKYRDREQAHERAAVILSNALPSNIETYKIVETANNLPITETSISASGYRKVAEERYVGASIQDATQQSSVNNQVMAGEPVYDGETPSQFSLSPYLVQAFGNAEGIYLYSVGVNADASYQLTSDLSLSSSVSFNVSDNYSDFTYIAPNDHTSNPRVRTLVRAYVHDNDAYVNNLQLTWLQKYGDNWYQQAYAGYLEMMFAGVGSELLYRPLGSSWALGADVNVVSQRDPSTWFATFSDGYDSALDSQVLDQGVTGHVSFYYAPSWSLLDNSLLRVDAGKFLAGDVGVRLDFSKQYRSGVVAGAYASLTDLSAQEFGEGSFTKGFYLSIPFDLMATKPSVKRVNLAWQPLTRDGGQKLDKKYSLFSVTDAASPWYERPLRE